MDSEKSTNQETSPVINLPTEMLQEIFHRLPFRDLLNCREVHSTWKRAATVPVRKRCAPFDFSRKEISKISKCSSVVQSFIELIRVVNQQGGLNEFPVAKFSLELHQNYYWIEVDGGILICQLLKAVSPFVKEIVFKFREESRQLPNIIGNIGNIIAIFEDMTFENLTEITLDVYDDKNKPCDSGVFSFIRNIIEKCPNVKEFHLKLDLGSEDGTRRCIVETGIQPKAGKVSSLEMFEAMNESPWEYFSKLGFKLKHLKVHTLPHDVNPEMWKKFLESQSDTLTTLTVLEGASSHHFRDLPCLPRLEELSIRCYQNLELQPQLPTLFYKEHLPALKKMDLTFAAHAAHYFTAGHLAPSESLRELIFPIFDIKDVGQFIRQVARTFLNLERLQVCHESANNYMSDIYEALPGIKELCISHMSAPDNEGVEHIITGLPRKLLRRIRRNRDNLHPHNYYWRKALAMLEQGTTRSLSRLENLKTLVIKRGIPDYDRNENDVGAADFSELSGVVLKRMKALERIDFGIRAYGPIVKLALQQDLEHHGIKLTYRLPPHKPYRTDFVVFR